ncbi:MAG: PEP-CTERM sorting domain-containing protein [Verrucomicrobiaceae bacterium]
MTLMAVGTALSQAAVTVSISGGAGSPVSVTVSEPITFTNVQPGRGFYGFVLVGAGAGNSILGFTSHVGDISWNGAGLDSGSGGMGSSTFADIMVTDLFAIWGSGNNAAPTTATMTLSAGTRTTTSSIAPVYLQGTGSYEIRVFDATTFGFISDPGTQVPEPTTLGMFTLGLGFLSRRRRG